VNARVYRGSAPGGPQTETNPSIRGPSGAVPNPRGNRMLAKPTSGKMIGGRSRTTIATGLTTNPHEGLDGPVAVKRTTTHHRYRRSIC
jgi:hypothetical protein